MGYESSHKIDEAAGIIAGIIISQEIEKSAKSFNFYEAVGPKAHEIIAKKGVEILKDNYFSYETFRLEGYFVVVATALSESGMRGKIIYESKTGKWVGTEDIRPEWLPLIATDDHQCHLELKWNNRKKSPREDE